MRTPSLAEFQRFAREHRSLAKAVVMAQAFAQIEQERVMAYIKPLFAEYGFKSTHTGELIADVEHLYLCDDDALCRDFYDAADHAHRQHGFDGPKDYWPNLIAQTLQMKAEHALIEAGRKAFGIDEIYSPELRDKFLKLLMGACLAKQAA